MPEFTGLTDDEKDRLRDWMWTVPAPQPIDPGPTVTPAPEEDA